MLGPARESDAEDEPPFQMVAKQAGHFIHPNDVDAVVVGLLYRKQAGLTGCAKAGKPSARAPRFKRSDLIAEVIDLNAVRVQP